MDGEFTHLIKKEGQPTFMVNKNGLVRTDCPITRGYDATTIKSVHMIGELFWGQGKKHELYNLLKNKDSDMLNFKAFDLVELDGYAMEKEDYTRRRRTLSRFSSMPSRRLVAHEKEAKNFFTAAVRNGYEGIVLKNVDERLILGPCGWFKWKYKDESDFKVVNIDPIKERMDVEVLRVDNQSSIVRQCGVKIMNADKKNISIGDMVTISHQGILSQGGLRHPVFVKKANQEE